MFNFKKNIFNMFWRYGLFQKLINDYFSHLYIGVCVCVCVTHPLLWYSFHLYIYHIYIYHWRRKRGGQGGHVPPHFFDWGGNGMFVPPPLLTPNFYFPLELYVYITLTNNNLAFFIYQLIILWTITIK